MSWTGCWDIWRMKAGSHAWLHRSPKHRSRTLYCTHLQCSWKLTFMEKCTLVCFAYACTLCPGIQTHEIEEQDAVDAVIVFAGRRWEREGCWIVFCIAIFWCSPQMGWSLVIVEVAGRVGGGDKLVQKAEAIQHYRNMRPVQARTWKGRGCPPTWKPEKCGNYEETGSFADLSAPACWWPGELGTTPTNV